ncbi:MAG: DNA-processing protein DprA [Nannocystales bacterium]
MLEFSTVSPGALGLRWTRPLYLAGRVSARPKVAVIGSRASRRRFMACVPGVIESLADSGMALVSGGAVGIDACAHRAAIQAGLPQIAVLPGPPDALYPADHIPLFLDIVAAGGAVVCPHPPGAGLRRGMFASRNQLVVQLASHVVGVEASARSGTQGTLALALRTGVPVCGVVGTAGVAWALERGAKSLGPPDVESVRSRLSALLRGFGGVEQWPAQLRALQAILDRQAAATVDDFDDPLAGAVSLIEAEAGGWVTEAAPGRYVRAR